ncbi:hypothetical protein EI94DRAFT_1592684 [Lactarius quietus]|nr:hypothetical protein EI94DRAFT_1592684 [Lactarius quietus]
MLGPQDAAVYHAALLRRGASPLEAYIYPEYHHFRAIPSPIPGLEPPTPWVVDYTATNIGTVIPQRRWVPPLQRDLLRPPIFFFERGQLGLPLGKAVVGDLMYLNDASRPAPVGPSSRNHAQIRINWCGYANWDEQIMIRTQARVPEIVPLERFVKHVARKVLKFMTDAMDRPYSYSYNNPRWFIGAGGITPEDVVLIGAVNVSQGSWMPILQLRHFVF